MRSKLKGRLLTQVIRTNAEKHEIEGDRREFRQIYGKHVTIRTFHRDVKADGLIFQVHIVTVRAPVLRVCSKCNRVIPDDYPTNVTCGECDGEIVTK